MQYTNDRVKNYEKYENNKNLKAIRKWLFTFPVTVKTALSMTPALHSRPNIINYYARMLE